MKTLTKKVGFEKDPVVLKACPGSEAVEAVDLQWGGLRGQRSPGRKQDRMRPVVSISGSLWKSSACVQ